jgi:hypothetical protein
MVVVEGCAVEPQHGEDFAACVPKCVTFAPEGSVTSACDAEPLSCLRVPRAGLPASYGWLGMKRKMRVGWGETFSLPAEVIDVKEGSHARAIFAFSTAC